MIAHTHTHMHAHTHRHNNVPTLKGVGVKGFAGERLRNRPLRVSASYDDHEGKHRYSPICITTKIAIYLLKKTTFKASSFLLEYRVGVNDSSLSI